VVEDPKAPKADGFGASVALVEFVLLPNGKGKEGTGAVVVLEVGAGPDGGGANEDDPSGVLVVEVSFTGIANGLGALDEPNALLVPLTSKKFGLDVEEAETLVEDVGVDNVADFKLSKPANDAGGGAGINGILGFEVSLSLEDPSNSF
jgi:hypothetical protein